MTNFAKHVYKIVSKIPRGRVLTYSEVARRAGKPRAARAVGTLMNRNPFSKDKVPCHRVVRADGTVGGYASGPNKKISLLRLEGIYIKGNKIVD